MLGINGIRSNTVYEHQTYIREISNNIIDDLQNKRLSQWKKSFDDYIWDFVYEMPLEPKDKVHLIPDLMNYKWDIVDNLVAWAIDYFQDAPIDTEELEMSYSDYIHGKDIDNPFDFFTYTTRFIYNQDSLTE